MTADAAPSRALSWEDLSWDDLELLREAGKLEEWRLAVDIYERDKAKRAAEYRPPIPDSPGALAAQLTQGREAQREHLNLIDNVLRRCRDGELDRVMIWMPPQVGKSRRVAEWGSLWLLATMIEWRIAIASYAQRLALKRSRFVRNRILEHPELGLELARGSAAVDSWDLAGHRGGMQAVGVGSSFTGDPADAMLIDDPVKDREAADSPVIRESTYDWYREVPELRAKHFILIMQTRWHEDDLSGRLLQEEGRDTEGGRWHVLSTPALAEPHQPRRDPATGEPSGPCPCGRPPDEPHDPIGRAVGEPLPHPTMDPAEYAVRVRQTQRVAPRTFTALLQQRPAPLEGGLVGHALLRNIRIPLTDLPVLRRKVVALDPSGGGDDEAGVVAGGLGLDRRAYLTHDRSARMSAADWGRAACLLAHETSADAFVVEKNYGGDQAGTILRQAWAALERDRDVTGLCPRIVEVTAKKGKVARAEPVAQAMREGRVGLAGVFPELEEQWATYQQGMDSPDRLDASVYLVTELLPDALFGDTRVTSPAAVRLPARVGAGGGRSRVR